MVSVQAAIEVRAIGQRARSSEEVTLRDVSLTVGHGELVAIIGGSGSGKTTLLDAMSGLRPPSSGTVTRSTGRSAHAGRYAGYIPNADTIHPALSLDQALAYTAALRAGEVLGGTAAEALRAVDLARQAATGVGQRSTPASASAPRSRSSCWPSRRSSSSRSPRSASTPPRGPR